MASFSKKIGVFQLSLLSVSAIVSLRSLPLFAEMGLSIIFFLLLAGILFFIPICMVVAELSTTWPLRGGCYLWIRKAYGKYWAFFALWAYWMESIIWFPTILIFVVVMLAHVLSPIYPNLESNRLFLSLGIVIIFWLLTIINFYGVKLSVMFSSIGVFIGTVIPIVLIIVCAFIWILNGEVININFTMVSIVPDFTINNMVFFSGVLLGFSGIELISFHMTEIENPRINIKKSLMISSFFILFVYIIGSLSIAVVIPKTDICFASGIIQALKIFFVKINLPYIVPFLALLLFIGSVSCVNTWLIGPAKGMLIAAEDGIMPKYLRYVNKNDVPVRLLIIQAMIGSIISVFFFLYINSINGLIWVFICLSFQFASLLYIVIFFSIIKLRKKYPNIYRPYKVPYVNLISFIGIFSCMFTFFISFIQPNDINISDKQFYFYLLLTSFIILIIPAIYFILLNMKRTK